MNAHTPRAVLFCGLLAFSIAVMVSGQGAGGEWGRCYTQWEDLVSCLEEHGRTGQRKRCVHQKEDYIECLHHTELVSCVETFCSKLKYWIMKLFAHPPSPTPHTHTHTHLHICSKPEWMQYKKRLIKEGKWPPKLKLSNITIHACMKVRTS